MNDELKPCELSELFIHEFRPMTSEERLECWKKMSAEFEKSSVTRQTRRWQISSFIYSLQELDCWAFFKRELPNGTILFLYRSIDVERKVKYWHLVAAPNGVTLQEHSVYIIGTVLQALAYAKEHFY